MPRKMRDPLVVLSGPTGAGRPALALRLAKRFGADIVNADAFQIYRGMEIGTAQPSPEDRAEAPHHLYGFRDPRAGMSAAEFAREADKVLEAIDQAGRRALVVGGA